MSGRDDAFDDLPWGAAPGAEPSDWEFAAAACELAILESDGGGWAALPTEVAERVASRAAAHVPPRRGSGHGSSLAARPARPAGGGAAAAGWLVAACLALLLAWQRDGARRAVDRAVDVKPPIAADVAGLRSRLLAEDSATITVPWKAGGDDRSIATAAAAGAPLGDVVWNATLQQGVMRFRGLAANDPAVEQYQLWIFDADRDEAHPVDGGVFDVAGDGEVLVAIDPRVPVGRATAFAVTVERPGGVVVSRRERLPLLAALP